MAEAVLVGHQLDKPRPAVGVEGADLLGREGARVGPHLAVVTEREGVLGVQLQLVDLPRREPVDEREEGLHRRHLVARDVDHHAAHREVGPVGDRANGERPVVRVTQLVEGGTRVEFARRVRGIDHDRVVADAQPVALARERGVHGRRGLSHDGVSGSCV